MAKMFGERFQVVHSEGNGLTKPVFMVVLDTLTGVQYLYGQFGNSGGMCPLIDQDGKPVAWEV